MSCPRTQHNKSRTSPLLGVSAKDTHITRGFTRLVQLCLRKGIRASLNYTELFRYNWIRHTHLFGSFMTSNDKARDFLLTKRLVPMGGAKESFKSMRLCTNLFNLSRASAQNRHIYRIPEGSRALGREINALFYWYS